LDVLNWGTTSQLEYASSVWCPYKVKYVEKLKGSREEQLN